MFSTIADLSKAGKAILDSTILSPAQTRRWLKPASHTSNVVNAVGFPWEIYSSAQHITSQVVDIYTKLGTTGVYSSYLGISPDYSVGFAILAAGQRESPDLNAYADIIAEYLLPAIVKTAQSEAQTAFAGTYRLSVGNSSIALSAADGLPGISVTSLVSNGVDTRAAYAVLNGIAPAALSFRLYPTNLRSEPPSGRFAFRAVFQDMDALEDAGTPTCVSWMGVDVLEYGGVALDLFVFEMGKDGTAEAVEIPALRMTLKKT